MLSHRRRSLHKLQHSQFPRLPKRLNPKYQTRKLLRHRQKFSHYLSRSARKAHTPTASAQPARFARTGCCGGGRESEGQATSEDRKQTRATTRLCTERKIVDGHHTRGGSTPDERSERGCLSGCCSLLSILEKGSRERDHNTTRKPPLGGFLLGEESHLHGFR